MKGFEQAKQEILEWLSDAIQVPVDRLELDKPLTDIGLDSLDAVHMIATIESIIGRELPEDIMQRVGCLDDVFDMMRDRMAAA